MHIKKLQLSNFQVLEEFDAEFFDGGIYFISGDNELGKSTVLKSIGILLGAKRDDLLQNGKEKGFAKMVVGKDGNEYEVSLSFTKANPRGTLTIKGSNGMKSNNVSTLQDIFGYTDYDAVEFSRWSETAEGRKKQVNVVKSLLPKEVVARLDQIATERSKAYNLRRDANLMVDRYKKVLDEAEGKLEPGDIEKYDKPKDVTSLLEKEKTRIQLEEKAKTATARKSEIEKLIVEIPDKRKRAVEEFEAAKAAYENTIIQLDAEEKDLKEREKRATDWLAEYEKIKQSEPADTLKEAEDWNKKAAIVADVKAKREELQYQKDQAESYDIGIKKLDKEKETLVLKSKLPIPGLSFTEDGLELKGVPFVPEKVSDSQIMEVAFRLIVASNPTVKVFRIARGESLGKKRLNDILEFAKNNGFQGFIERVVPGQMEIDITEYTEA